MFAYLSRMISKPENSLKKLKIIDKVIIELKLATKERKSKRTN